MIALINAFNAIDHDSIGTVVSTHRTLEAAEKAEAKFQRAVKRASRNSYMPTRIVCLRQAQVKRTHVHPDNVD